MLIIFCLALIASASCFESRIVDGTPTTIIKHPYQISIHYKDKFICGGSIISERWILTAAHCVYGEKTLSVFKVRVGSMYHNKGGILIKDIASIICHKKYHPLTYDYDVSLIKLSAPLTFGEYIKPILLALPLMNIKTGTQAIVTGWGKTSANGPSSEVLQTATISVTDQEKCRKVYARNRLVTSNMICAGDNKGEKDTCQGDSGGALVGYNGLQIGIVSWGAQECASVGFPGVYTRVPAIRQWVTEQANV
ncbi:Trypsin-1 [Atta colombica]|uniref:Trypsin-1 n=1 Tax=Atta colombica TaxID=520822 RepID=A0A195B099_9HYME|nr:PREDICTED: trypsin-1-like [Atta colombica]KYM77715.1 Trypsin-1 [Atta colombica]